MKSVGVLGAGSIADVYVRNAARMRNYRVVAVADVDAERTRARAPPGASQRKRRTG